MEWISVKDRMPEGELHDRSVSNWVLVTCAHRTNSLPFSVAKYANKSNGGFGFYNKGWHFWDEESIKCADLLLDSSDFYREEITHWMPVPNVISQLTSKNMEAISNLFNIPRQGSSLDKDVDQPAHYQGKTMSVIDVIEDYDLDFNEGNVLKYFLRRKKKGQEMKDLKKTAWCVKREIEKLELNI